MFGQQAACPNADNISAVAEVPGPKREEGGCQLCKRLRVRSTEAEQAVHVIVVVAAPLVYGPAFMEESAGSTTVQFARVPVWWKWMVQWDAEHRVKSAWPSRHTA